MIDKKWERGGLIKGLSKGLVTLMVGALFVLTSVEQPVLAQGAGDLIVAPTRVVLEGRKRTAQLTLSNTGSETANYRISVVNMRMNDDGSVTEITEPDEGQNFAGKLFRYSPRQVTLAPGDAQAIRILVRKPKNLEDGEYRSHLLFRAIPDEGGQSVEQPAEGGGLQIRLIPVYGITLPVIIRHGKVSSNVSLSELNVIPPNETSPLPFLSFRITRTGNASAFGDFTATHVSSSGDETIVGEVQRLAVYTPNKSRTVSIALRVPDGVELSGGKINLAFKATEDAGGKLLGEADLNLP